VIAVVDQALCAGCGDCIDACAEEALSMEQGLTVVDAPRCTGCGACVEVCSTEAMSMSIHGPVVTPAQGDDVNGEKGGKGGSA
jgi:ferredoxin